MRGAALTPEIARAAGWDAADRSMRDAGRTVWDVDDYNEAVRVTNALLDRLGEDWGARALREQDDRNAPWRGTTRP